MTEDYASYQELFVLDAIKEVAEQDFSFMTDAEASVYRNTLDSMQQLMESGDAKVYLETLKGMLGTLKSILNDCAWRVSYGDATNRERLWISRVLFLIECGHMVGLDHADDGSWRFFVEESKEGTPPEKVVGIVGYGTDRYSATGVAFRRWYELDGSRKEYADLAKALL